MTDSTAADSIAAGSTAAAGLVADSSDCDYSCPTDDYHQTLGKSRRSHRGVDADSLLVRDYCERNSKGNLPGVLVTLLRLDSQASSRNDSSLC